MKRAAARMTSKGSGTYSVVADPELDGRDADPPQQSAACRANCESEN
jgi:hypothetical protein